LRKHHLGGKITRLRGRSRFAIQITDHTLPRGVSIVFHGPDSDPYNAWRWHLGYDVNALALLRIELGLPLHSRGRSRRASKSNALPVEYLRDLENPEDYADHRWIQCRLLNANLQKIAEWLATHLQRAKSEVIKTTASNRRPPLTMHDIQARLNNVELCVDHLADELPVAIPKIVRIFRQVFPDFVEYQRLGWIGGVATLLKCHRVGAYAWGGARAFREDHRLRSISLRWNFTSTAEASIGIDDLWARVKKRGGPFIPTLVWTAFFDGSDLVHAGMPLVVSKRFRSENGEIATDLVTRAEVEPLRSGNPRGRRKGGPIPKVLSDNERAVADRLGMLKLFRRSGTYHWIQNPYRLAMAVRRARIES
jgi:hypothetical protein